MSLKSLNKIETNKYELTVTVNADEFEAAIAKAYRKNVGKINVQGFRKGKAPRHISKSSMVKAFSMRTP